MKPLGYVDRVTFSDNKKGFNTFTELINIKVYSMKGSEESSLTEICRRNQETHIKVHLGH